MPAEGSQAWRCGAPVAAAAHASQTIRRSRFFLSVASRLKRGARVPLAYEEVLWCILLMRCAGATRVAALADPGCCPVALSDPGWCPDSGSCPAWLWLTLADAVALTVQAIRVTNSTRAEAPQATRVASPPTYSPHPNPSPSLCDTSNPPPRLFRHLLTRAYSPTLQPCNRTPHPYTSPHPYNPTPRPPQP